MTQNRFLNPYNFVRPLPAPQNIPPLSKKTADLHLLWRCPPPPHDRYTGLSGRITCEMTAKTPVFVSDSEDYEPKDDPKAHKTYRFFNVNGEDMIPASSLRGAIRSVFEAATNSTFGAFTFKDEPLFYRRPPDTALGLVPARVERDDNSESGYKLSLLTGFFERRLESKNLYAAWIPQYPNPGTKRPKHLLKEIVEIPNELRNGQVKCWAYVINTKDLVQQETAYGNQRKGFPHWQVEYIAKTEQEAFDWFRGLQNDRKKRNQSGYITQYKLVSGYVYATGLNANVKQYERFFYYGKQKCYIKLKQDNINAYNRLMSDYHKRKDSIDNSLNNAERENIQSSRFIRRLEQLKEGTLVYAEIDTSVNGNIYNVTAIYPVAISRAMYERTIRDVITSCHPYLLPPIDIKKLCLASRVFGWVSQEGDEDLTKEVAYRGRVRFSNATVTHANKNDTSLTLSILGSPHPTSVEFYLDGVQKIKLQRSGKHGYDEDGAKIRGRKMYRHHKNWSCDEATSDEQSDQNRTIKGVYEPDSTWEFTIDFENLQPVELGALLWTLKLHESGKQSYHRIGYGKPLGFGSVQIEVAGLEFYDAKTRYTSEQTEFADEEKCDELIECFQGAMKQLYRKDEKEFAQLCNIQDILSLLSEHTDKLPIHYPRLEREKTEDSKGFQWFMKNRDRKQSEHLGPAQDDDGLLYND